MLPFAIAFPIDVSSPHASANDNEPMSTFLLVLKGQIAALTGETLGDNPYKFDSPEGRCWTTGWLNMQADLRESAEAVTPARPSRRAPSDLRVVTTPVMT